MPAATPHDDAPMGHDTSSRALDLPADVDLRELRRLAVGTAAAAADLVRERSGAAALAAQTKSSSVDLVTDADRAAEALVRRLLRAARPDDAILGEEEPASAGSSGLTWIIDPIDGTTNFVYGLASWAVSIAVVAGDPVPGRWRPLAACVDAPAMGASWSATEGGGAWRDGRRLAVRADVPLATSLVATGFAYTPQRRAAQAALLGHVLPRVRDIRRLGSAAVDLCLVAEGRLDAFYEQFLNPWDVAAGWLVVTEAGGGADVLVGADPGQSCTVAAGPGLLEELSRVLRHGLNGGAPAEP